MRGLPLSAPKLQRFLRFAIAMPIADPRNRAISETRESNDALRFKGAMEVASNLRFRAAISQPKTPSFCGISGDLAPSTRKSLAIAIARFWCAKVYPDLLFLAFLDFLAFFFSRNSLRSFSKHSGGSEETDNPCFFGGFPCLSPPQKEQGKEDQATGRSPAKNIYFYVPFLSVTQRGGGATRGGVRKCEHTQTNADKRSSKFPMHSELICYRGAPCAGTIFL